MPAEIWTVKNVILTTEVTVERISSTGFAKTNGEDSNCCDGCKYEHKAEYESPCIKCCNNYTSKFERRLKKTRQDEFLEHYPNAKKCKDILGICPDDVDVDYNVCESYPRCEECRRDYWLQEVEK